MANSSSLLTSGQDTSAGQTTVATASVSPSANARLSFAVWVRGQPATTPTCSGGGLTWSLTKTEADGLGVATLYLWEAYGSATSGAVTMTRGGSDTWFQSAHALVQTTGTATSGITVQSKSTSAETATDPYGVTYDATFGAGNSGLAFFFIKGGNYASTPRSGWTELADFGVTGGVGQMAAHWRADSDTDASANYGGAPGTQVKYAIAVEVKVAAASNIAGPLVGSVPLKALVGGALA